MLPLSEEDKLKSEIAREVASSNGFLDISSFIQECKRMYELKKYGLENNDETRFQRIKSRAFEIFHRETLEEKLVRFAQLYQNVNYKEKRKIDVRAYKTIKWCKECKSNRELVRYYYYEVFGTLKDFYRGIGYIHERDEPEEEF
jgi:hypothetical protein